MYFYRSFSTAILAVKGLMLRSGSRTLRVSSTFPCLAVELTLTVLRSPEELHEEVCGDPGPFNYLPASCVSHLAERLSGNLFF